MMAGTDVFFCQCETFHLLCNLLSAKNEMLREKMRLQFETGGGESKFKSVTSLHMMDQWRCQGALVDTIYCLWMFFFCFSPFLLPLPKFGSLSPSKLSSWTESRQPVFTHHISAGKGGKPAERLSDIAGYVTFSSALNKTFSLIRFQLDSIYYYYFILSFFFLHSTCKDKEIIFREAKVFMNLYCRMIRVSLF